MYIESLILQLKTPLCTKAIPDCKPVANTQLIKSNWGIIPWYGSFPEVIISYNTTPNDHTSPFKLWRPNLITSGASHLTGIRLSEIYCTRVAEIICCYTIWYYIITYYLYVYSVLCYYCATFRASFMVMGTVRAIDK